jgi:hypothetical protein
MWRPRPELGCCAAKRKKLTVKVRMGGGLRRIRVEWNDDNCIDYMSGSCSLYVSEWLITSLSVQCRSVFLPILHRLESTWNALVWFVWSLFVAVVRIQNCLSQTKYRIIWIITNIILIGTFTAYTNTCRNEITGGHSLRFTHRLKLNSPSVFPVQPTINVGVQTCLSLRLVKTCNWRRSTSY